MSDACDRARRALLAGGAAALVAAAAPVAGPTPRPRQGENARPPRAGARPEPRHSGLCGWLVRDAVTGALLDARDAGLAMAPASVAKLVTALYALETLGPEHRFATEIRARGALAGRRLAGDLALAGGGDPELDSAALGALAAETAGRVADVTGRFLAEGPAVAPLIDPDQPPEAPYNPGVGALNLNFNRVRLAWRRSSARLETRLEAHSERASPPTEAVGLALESPDCACPPFAWVDAPGRELWRVRADALRGEGAVFLPVRRPTVYAAEVFRAAAAAAGLRLPAPLVAPTQVGGAALARVESRPLREMLADMLRFSTNLTAEAVGLAATRARGGAPEGGPAALAASGAAMSAWARARSGGAAFALANHSGLSAASRASAEALVAFLRAPGAGAALAPLIAPYRFAPQGAAVLAKTGTLDYARALAGWLILSSGRTLAFAILSNDLDRRAASRGAPEGAAQVWRDAATAFERALLADWAARFG